MEEKKIKMDRRKMLQISGLALGTALIESCSSSSKNNEDLPFSVENKQQVFRAVQKSNDDSPINRQMGERAPFQFSEEDPDPSHQILWDVPRYIKTLGGNVPAVTGQYDVVVIGGGMSGLLSAYQLKKHNVIVLESGSRFGGNSQGGSWKGIDYGTGAQKISKPDSGSPIDQFLKDLDLYKELKEIPGMISVIQAGVFKQNLLTEDPASQAQLKALSQYFNSIKGTGAPSPFPHMPPRNDAEKAVLKTLDQKSLYAHLKGVIGGGNFAPGLEAWLEHYCWSYFGASSASVSAAVGVNHMSSVFGREMTANGGNALIAEQLLKKLKRSLGSDKLKAGALVFQVKRESTGVKVSYIEQGQAKTIQAKAVIFACPQFVIPKILVDLDPEKEAAIQQLEYRSCLLASVLIQGKLPRSFFEVDIQQNSRINLKEPQASADRDRSTHAFNGSYAMVEAKSGVLNVLRPFPYMFGRPQIYGSGAYLTYRRELIAQIESEILPALKIPNSSIAGLRITRWGHALPVPEIGKWNRGTLEILQRPIENKIFFINQDNWLNPRFEVIFHEAQKWSSLVAEALEKSKKVTKPPA